MTVSTFRKWAMAVLVIASLAWTIKYWNRPHVSGYGVLWVGIAVVVAEVLFIGGAALMVRSSGRAVFRGTGPHPLAWIAAIRRTRKAWKEEISTSPEFRRGLYLNWLGALGTTGLIPIVVIATSLPVGSWGLMSPFAIDVVASCVLRRAVQVKLEKGAVA